MDMIKYGKCRWAPAIVELACLLLLSNPSSTTACRNASSLSANYAAVPDNKSSSFVNEALIGFFRRPPLPAPTQQADGLDDQHDVGGAAAAARLGTRERHVERTVKHLFAEGDRDGWQNISSYSWESASNRKRIRRKSANKHVLTLMALLDLTCLADLPVDEVTDPTAAACQAGRGYVIQNAAYLAVQHINAAAILGPYHLRLWINDSKCDPGSGVDAFFHSIYSTNHALRNISQPGLTQLLPIILGPGCVGVTESVAKVTSYWNVVQISYGSISAVLSNRKKFPYFHRTIAPEASHHQARLAFLQHFGWNRVSVIAENRDEYTLVINGLGATLEVANVSLITTLTFAANDFEDQILALKSLEARIIFGSFSHDVAPHVLCAVYWQRLHGPDHVWILPGGISHSPWWRKGTKEAKLPSHHRLNCTAKQLEEAVEGIFLVETHSSTIAENKTVFTSWDNITDVRRLVRNVMNQGDLDSTMYDAVWTAALAFRGVLQNFQAKTGQSALADDFLQNNSVLVPALAAAIANLKFYGASGPVMFDHSDRVGISALFQIQRGEAKRIALYHPDMGLDLNCSACAPIRWVSGQVPVDSRIIQVVIRTIAAAAFTTIALFATLGIGLAIVCLTFNLIHRKRKYIKLSSPKLNNIAVVGAVLVYTAVILWGLDHDTLPSDDCFAQICTARVYLLSAGFSLAFGAMFAKTFRVHRIFAPRNSVVVKDKMLSDARLIGMIGMLLLLDTLIITSWIMFDPMTRQLLNLTLEISPVDRTLAYLPQLEVCRSEYMLLWLGILYTSKGLLLVAGAYMAWETRRVEIPALNDSQYIGMNVYNVVMTSIAVLVCGLLLSEQATLAFVVVSTLILISTTTALCLLFLPKFHAILRHGEKDPIANSTGLTNQNKTRRMVVDDKQESYERAQIQNSYYAKRITTLDMEIEKLQNLLYRKLSVASLTCSETLDRFTSTIQAEATLLYALLDEDDENREAIIEPRVQRSGVRSLIWTYNNNSKTRSAGSTAMSRSCTSLTESHEFSQMRVLSKWWTSLSALYKQPPSKLKIKNAWPAIREAWMCSSPSTTLIQLNVTTTTCSLGSTAAVYQLLDKSLILPAHDSSPSHHFRE